MYNKFDEIENYLLNNRHIDILALTESRITKNISDNEIKIDDFDLLRCDAESSFTGGVTVYVRRTLKYRKLFSISYEGNC